MLAWSQNLKKAATRPRMPVSLAVFDDCTSFASFRSRRKVFLVFALVEKYFYFSLSSKTKNRRKLIVENYDVICVTGKESMSKYFNYVSMMFKWPVVSLFLSKKKKLKNKNKLFQAFDVLFDRPPIRCNIKSPALQNYGGDSERLRDCRKMTQTSSRWDLTVLENALRVALATGVWRLVQNVARFKRHFRSHPVVYTLLCEVLLKTTIREARTDMKMLTSVLFWWQALSTFFLEVQQNGERIGLQFQSLQEDCTNKDLLLPKVYWNLENSIMETTSCLWFENTLNKNKKFDWKNFAHDVQAWSGLCVVQVGPIQQLSNCVSGHKNHN
jgi:hypothetical protein